MDPSNPTAPPPLPFPLDRPFPFFPPPPLACHFHRPPLVSACSPIPRCPFFPHCPPLLPPHCVSPLCPSAPRLSYQYHHPMPLPVFPPPNPCSVSNASQEIGTPELTPAGDGGAAADGDSLKEEWMQELEGDDGGEDEEQEVFVLTDEWMEFFAKSEAKRRLEKQKQKLTRQRE